MICDHPDCTGKHSGTPRSSWCPAAIARHAKSVANRRRDPEAHERYKARQREHYRKLSANSPEYRERKAAAARDYYHSNEEYRIRQLALKRENYISHPRVSANPCCRDSGGSCPQHQQWWNFRHNERTYASRCSDSQQLAMLAGVPAGGDIGYSVRRNPDTYWPDSAEDRAQEKAIAEWLKTKAA